MQGTGVDHRARSGAGLRAVRAAVFTALCVTLSAASHVLLSRTPLPTATLAALCAAVFAAAYALTGRERGYGAVAALLVPLELAADTVLTTGQHACYGPAGGPVTGPLHSVGVDLLCRGGEWGTPLAGVADRPGGPLPAAPWLLLAGHLAAGLLAAAWLRRGDAALDRLLRAAAAEAFRPLRTVRAPAAAPLPPRHRTRPPGPRPRAYGLPLLVRCLPRRGPPAAVAP
ncbi:hypothetical protein [Streptomyces pinistramenti]|uniref:hypothetical protein n=1 Tax=Streptomyces pinistramenti TaxID=2884812 RepID=UPI001D05E944|nr:hypothetical protein [Streptomyces pinistramenti]MCB5910482.1 hypothetical protein [Streptomyces pinistramenti]